MDAADYDAWYDTPRGRWIGETEYHSAKYLLGPRAGDTVLDVGCGTGWFTRRFAQDGFSITGIDPSEDWLAFAKQRAAPLTTFMRGDARHLPFADASFDLGVSIAANCFIDDERQALAEIVRVSRRRVVIGWLNRHSVLYWQKGRSGGVGAYRGARWHTAQEVRALFDGLPVANLELSTAIFLPGGGKLARCAETWIPKSLPWGGMLFAAGDIARN